ncbi:hypothetical protein AB0M00_12630 [Streptomyces chartreusis]
MNDDPYGDSWIAEVTVADPADLKGLLTPAEYQKLTSE